MIQCDSDMCEVRWFHMSCMKLKKVAKENGTDLIVESKVNNFSGRCHNVIECVRECGVVLGKPYSYHRPTRLLSPHGFLH